MGQPVEGLFPRPHERYVDQIVFMAHASTFDGRRDRQDTVFAACDFCGRPLENERHRFVWSGGLSEEVVLADLCPSCATSADGLLELHGGHGRDAIRLTQADRGSVVEHGRTRRLGGSLGRGLVYVAIALAAFAVVTVLTARG